MRISDWSSDVCSSDLISRSRPCRSQPWRRRSPGSSSCPAHRPSAYPAQRSEERRVGKSVSVRVDLGGRRIIKKKKSRHTPTQYIRELYQAKQLTPYLSDRYP